MNSSRFVARNELFGKTVFDRSSFGFLFMDNDQYETFSSKHDVDELANHPSLINPEFLSAPIRTYFDLTLACNLNCITCLNDSGKALDDELDTEEGLSVVEKLAKDGVFQVKFSGGEPTMKRDWLTIMEHAKAQGLSVTMNSNGIYNAKTLTDVTGLRPDEVTISLDGFEGTNDKIRGQGMYARAVDTIKALSTEGIRVCINTVVTKNLTEHDVHGLVGLASEYCYDISFFHPRPFGRAALIQSQLPDYFELEAFMSMVDRVKNDYTGTSVRTRSHSILANALGLSASQVGLMTGGSDGFTRFNIMPTGNMFAGGCVPYVSPDDTYLVILGNIRDFDYSVMPVWKNSAKLDDIRKQSHTLQERCNSCDDYRKRCSGFTLDMELFRRVKGYNPYCKH